MNQGIELLYFLCIKLIKIKPRERFKLFFRIRI
jgi:hypothetical protein